jgi:hypothetical protein
MIPEERYGTKEALDSLVARFSLPPPGPFTQDWEWEFADPSRLEELLFILEREVLTDDERFMLSQMVMECFDRIDTKSAVDDGDQWKRFVALLRLRPALHAYALYYWSCWDSDLDDAFHISRLVRPLWTEYEESV